MTTDEQMTTNHDEFWGAQADWPETPHSDRSGPRASVGSKVSRWWGAAVGGSTTAHRHHGGPSVTPGPSLSADDEYAEYLEPADDFETHAPTEQWDAEWEVEPSPAPRGGVDPLLARLGGAAIVLTLLVPLFLGFGSGSEGKSDAAAPPDEPVTLALPSTAAVVAVAPSTVGSSVATSADSSALSGAAAAVDIETAPASSASVSGAPTTSTPQTVAAQSSSNAAATTDDGIAAGALANDSAERVEQSCAVDYTVVAGDFWIRLEDASDTPLTQLLDVNGATTDTPMYPGSTICLPNGASTPAPPTTAPAVTTPAVIAPVAAPAATVAKPKSTSPTTTMKPPVTPAPTLNAAQVQQIIRDVWPDELEDRAIEIADRESNFISTAKNYCCYGIFQIYWSVHKSWLAGLGITSADQLFDVQTNARAAYALYQRSGGWGPWT